MNVIMQAFPALLLVFCRITSFFVVAPIFSAKNVPASFKIGISAFLSFITFSLIEAKPVDFDGDFVLLLFKEIVVGLSLGFVAYIFFSVVQTAGSFIDMQMGFSMANIIDPMTGVQSPVIGNLKFMIAVLLFLSLNGHHYLIRAIIESYQWVPLDGNIFHSMNSGSMSDFLVKSFSESFALAFQMAAPLVAAMFLVDVGLGILAKTAPQFNIFVIGVPLKIVVGLLLLMMVIPGFVSLFSDVFQKMLEEMQNLLARISA